MFKPKTFSTYKRPKMDRNPDIKNSVWRKTGGVCYYCGCTLVPFGGEKNSFTMDHVVSLKNGGNDDIDNLVPACKSCNSRKGAR